MKQSLTKALSPSSANMKTLLDTKVAENFIKDPFYWPKEMKLSYVVNKKHNIALITLNLLLPFFLLAATLFIFSLSGILVAYLMAIMAICEIYFCTILVTGPSDGLPFVIICKKFFPSFYYSLSLSFKNKDLGAVSYSDETFYINGKKIQNENLINKLYSVFGEEMLKLTKDKFIEMEKIKNLKVQEDYLSLKALKEREKNLEAFMNKKPMKKVLSLNPVEKVSHESLSDLSILS